MAWQQTDMDALDAAIARGVKAVTYADGRKVEYHSLDEMRRLRIDMKSEISATASRSSRPTRVIVGRTRR